MKASSLTSKQSRPPPQLTSVGQVSEGDQVKLRCLAPVPCSTLPPSITWLPRDPSRQEQTQTQQSLDGLRTMTSTLTFAASAEHHNQSVSCSVSYPLIRGGSSRPPPGHPHPHRPVRSQSNRGNAQHVGSRPRGQQRDLHLSERRQPACEPLHLVQSGRRRVDEDGGGTDAGPEGHSEGQRGSSVRSSNPEALPAVRTCDPGGQRRHRQQVGGGGGGSLRPVWSVAGRLHGDCGGGCV
ncbi:uncharacterized protein LOC120827000 isoform X2 [Gasterosteus aculeatus]